MPPQVSVTTNIVAELSEESTFPDVQGYILSFTAMEPGDYVLEVFQSWIYGDAEDFIGPIPILVGGPELVFLLHISLWFHR